MRSKYCFDFHGVINDVFYDAEYVCAFNCFKLTWYFCFTLIMLMSLSTPLLPGAILDCSKKYRILLPRPVSLP